MDINKKKFIKEFIKNVLNARSCQDFSKLTDLLDQNTDLEINEIIGLLNYLENKHTQMHISHLSSLINNQQNPIFEFLTEIDPIQQERENLKYLYNQELDKVKAGETHNLATVKKVLKT